jgi:hypothetical protein
VVTARAQLFCDEFSGIVFAAGKNGCGFATAPGIRPHFANKDTHI